MVFTKGSFQSPKGVMTHMLTTTSLEETRTTKLPRRGSGQLIHQAKTLQPVELPAECEVCSGSPAFVSSYPAHPSFGDDAIFRVLSAPVSNHPLPVVV